MTEHNSSLEYLTDNISNKKLGLRWFPHKDFILINQRFRPLRPMGTFGSPFENLSE
jgi:hypothetical protein